MELSAADLKLILQSLEDSAFDQAEVVIGDIRIAVGRNGAVVPSNTPAEVPAATPSLTPAATPPAATPSAVAPAAPVASAPPEPTSSGHDVKSPTVGVFWRAPQPGAAPFVEVGQEVAAGDTIGIVEVMKLMTNVEAEVAGVITAIHVENAGSVQHGTPLATVEPKV